MKPYDDLDHRPGERWQHEAKARAIQLMAEGYSYHRIQQELERDFGSAPALGALSAWRNDANVSEVIRTANEQIAIRSQRLMHRGYDWLDQQPDSYLAKPNVFAQLYTAGGIAQDKNQRDREPALNVGVYVVVPVSQANQQHPELKPTKTAQELDSITHEIEIVREASEGNPEG